MTLAEEKVYAMFLASGPFWQAWVDAMQARSPQDADGDEIDRMRGGISGWCATGAGVFEPHFLALLGEACMQLGKTDDAITANDEGLEVARRTGERFYESELHRLHGELLRRTNINEASMAFQRAIDLASRQQAKSLELRAAMSLARLRRDQGKKAEARDLLASIYDWFTEGFDTADLNDAKALLEELK